MTFCCIVWLNSQRLDVSQNLFFFSCSFYRLFYFSSSLLYLLFLTKHRTEIKNKLIFSILQNLPRKCSRVWQTALTESSVSKSTNPKPRDIPVAESILISISRTTPKASKYALSEAKNKDLEANLVLLDLKSISYQYWYFWKFLQQTFWYCWENLESW